MAAPTAETFTPVAGTDGRVVDRANGIILAGIQTWRRTSSAAAIRLPHFESPANDDGLVQPEKLRGLGDNKVRISGVTSKTADTGTHGYLENGLAVTLDLFVSKGSALGYQGVAGFVSNFELGNDINDKACDFTADVEVDGVFPAYGTISYS